MRWNTNCFLYVRDTVAGGWSGSSVRHKAVARLDVFASLALVAERNHYVRPKINETGIIDIKDGRHPVVEKMIPNDMFIANDTYLDNNEKTVFPLSQDRTWQVNPHTCARQP